MKRFKDVAFLTASVIFILASCTKSSTSSTTDGNWIKRSELDGVARTEAASFVIGNLAYIVTGYDGTNRLNDIWSYDANKNSWSQKAQFPGVARSSAVGFTVDSLGYISTGYDGVNRLKDTWQYSPASNTWKQRADFGGSARYDAVAFGINHSGYITTGYDGNYTKDFWEYTPANDTWTQKTSLGGSKRSQAVAFVYNNIAYVVTGINNGLVVNDMWAYDPSTSTWSQKRNISNTSTDSYDDDYTDIQRYNAVAFIMGDKAFITTGENGAYISKTWQYNFSDDTWERKTAYERSSRTGAIAFTVLGKGFVGSGKSATNVFDDFDEFHPTETYDSND